MQLRVLFFYIVVFVVVKWDSSYDPSVLILSKRENVWAAFAKTLLLVAVNTFTSYSHSVNGIDKPGHIYVSRFVTVNGLNDESSVAWCFK